MWEKLNGLLLKEKKSLLEVVRYLNSIKCGREGD